MTLPDCSGKKRYYTRRRANFYKKLASVTHGKKFWAYRCPLCEFWHLTTTAPRGPIEAPRQ